MSGAFTEMLTSSSAGNEQCVFLCYVSGVINQKVDAKQWEKNLFSSCEVAKGFGHLIN